MSRVEPDEYQYDEEQQQRDWAEARPSDGFQIDSPHGGVYTHNTTTSLPSAVYPETIRQFWYAIDWDVEYLWTLQLDVVDCPMHRLVWHLDVPVWPDEDGSPYAATPRAVLDAPHVHVREAARIASADVTYPLEVYELRGRLMILDGIHRLAQQHAAGTTVVRVRVVPESAVQHVCAARLNVQTQT